ncbi:MAG: cupin domain-containing protein [Acidimicrobiales bacterium]
MAEHLNAPSLVPGVEPKLIEEYFGGVNSGHDDISIARMVAPPGWTEPGQRPLFREMTVVLEGRLHAETESGLVEVSAGEAFVSEPGEWVRYSTPDTSGATYIAVCTPGFSPERVNRD